MAEGSKSAGLFRKAIDQYISMVQEKTIAGESRRWPGWPNLAPSSEADGYWLFSFTRPTVRVGGLKFGTLQRPGA